MVLPIVLISGAQQSSILSEQIYIHEYAFIMFSIVYWAVLHLKNRLITFSDVTNCNCETQMKVITLNRGCPKRMVIILSTSLWLHQLLSSRWWPSHPLTMLGTGRHSLWNICRQWKTTMLKGFAASRGRGQGRKKSSGQPQFHFPARSCPGRIANLQLHPSQVAWLNTGQAWVLLLWGPQLAAWLPNQLLQLHTGDDFMARQQHLL